MLAYRAFIAARGLWERLGRREPEAPDPLVSRAKRNEAPVGRDRSSDDAVTEVERLVRLARIESFGDQCWTAAPVPASIQRTVASSKRRLIV